MLFEPVSLNLARLNSSKFLDKDIIENDKNYDGSNEPLLPQEDHSAQ
jgi:hypothetical protein